MTDQPPNDNDLVVRDEISGDVIQETGSLMNERQSYERVIDGLKIAGEACAHLELTEPENRAYWRCMRLMFDKLRRAAMNVSGLELTMKFKETSEARGLAMPWKQARNRLREGLKQAGGGMRQLSGCHRGDMVFARMATELETMEAKIKSAMVARARSGLILVP